MWGVIKKSLNGTVGGSMKSLDKIIKQSAYNTTYWNVWITTLGSEQLRSFVHFHNEPLDVIIETSEYANNDSITGIFWLPPTIKTIKVSAFKGSSIQSIFFPPSCSEIGIQAFMECPNLSLVELPDEIDEIAGFCFRNCTALKRIFIPNGVKNIQLGAFYGCSNLADIHYDGTITQWNEIKKGSNWDLYTGNYVVHCNDGDISKV